MTAAVAAGALVGLGLALVLAGLIVDRAHGGKHLPVRAVFGMGLSEGASVTVPLEKQMWGDEFGALIDRFGISWMINIGSGDPPQG